MLHGFRVSLSVFALVLAAGAAAQPLPAAITGDAIAAHVEILASDAFEGREPGTAGETKTVAYIEAAYRGIGLTPVSGDSYRLPVPLLRSEALSGEIAVGALRLEDGPGMTARPRLADESGDAAGEVVFVGYGIHAPKQDRDDFAGAELHGRIALVLAGEPPGQTLHDAARAQATRPAKRATALRAGAAAVIVLYDLGPDDPVWTATRETVSRTALRLDGSAAGSGDILSAVVGGDTARRLAAALGADLAALKAEASADGFRPRVLGQGRIAAANRLVRFSSDNVAGLLRGSERPDDYIVYLAHWDHLGHCGTGADTICNGAVDNASGVGGIIELARAFASGPRPKRSVLFLATTAEESGLIGARHFASAGPIPAARMVAAFGLDTIAASGPARDVIILGQGLSTLDTVIARAARRSGRKVVSMREPQGFYARSDHFGFAETGVPAVIATGMFAAGGSFDRYMSERYHKPSDEASAAIDYRGAADDANLLLDVGRTLANGRSWPRWQKSSPYQRRP